MQDTLSSQSLTEEASKLLVVTLDDLYVTLGSQLLVYEAPGKVAGIVSYLRSIRSASEARVLFEALPSAPLVGDWSKGLGVICDDLKDAGIRYLKGAAEELRNGLDNEDILRLAENPSKTQLQVLLMLVASILKLPREMETVAATVTVVLVKTGLRKFFRLSEA